MVLVWGYNFVAIKQLYAAVPPEVIALVRPLLMFPFLAALTALSGEKVSYPQGETWRILLLGFLAMGVYMVLFLEGMRYATPAEGAILLAASPILTTLIAMAVRQEAYSPKVLVGACAAFGGVAMVVLAGAAEAHGKLLGYVLLLTSALAWAASSVYSKRLVSAYSPMRILTLSLPGAAPILLVYGGAKSLAIDWTSLSLGSWLLFAHVVLLAGVVGFWGFYAGVRQIGASGAMLYQFFVPPTAVIFSYAVLGRPVGALQLAGMVVIAASVAYSLHARRRAEPEHGLPLETPA